MSRRIRAGVSFLVAVQLAGCSGRYPARVTSPNIDAAAAARAAISLYDLDGGGTLDKEELDACPGMLSAFDLYDLDRNGLLSQEEIASRIRDWRKGPGMMSLDCRVTLDGQPLIGATVTFEPEPYLGESIKFASGTTGPNGVAFVTIASEDLPEKHQSIRAMTAGVYKIRVSHPAKEIPAKYNEQTTLGFEVSKETVPNTSLPLVLESS